MDGSESWLKTGLDASVFHHKRLVFTEQCCVGLSGEVPNFSLLHQSVAVMIVASCVVVAREEGFSSSVTSSGLTKRQYWGPRSIVDMGCIDPGHRDKRDFDLLRAED